MCLIVFAWRPEHALPLVVAANRDEFYARPSLPLSVWKDAPGVIAGRDLEAGGTWLGVGPQGRFAALTNIRNPRQPPAGRSRGELVAEFLRSQQTPETYLAELAQRASDYPGFNLLVGSTDEFWHFNSWEGLPQRLSSGIYGLSNAGLDTPWPKLQRAKLALAERLDAPRAPALLELLADPQQAPEAALPETGIGLATERLLSSIFIASSSYGTRASSALIVRADGRRQLIERSYGPYGAHLGEVSLEC
ncbi:MAG: NRDE family protein [Pseudomonas sp.]